MTQYDETIVSLETLEWSNQLDQVFDILEREYELAPENLRLKNSLYGRIYHIK